MPDLTGTVPGPADDVTIDIPNANVTITHDSGTHTIRRLVANDPLTLSGGELLVTTTVQANATFKLSGGALTQATIIAGSGGARVVASSTS